MSKEKLISDSAGAGLAIGTNVVAGYTWIAQVNELLQLILTIIAIISGMYTINYHVLKMRKLNNAIKRKKTEPETRQQP
ncbi:MAG: hypothetical protein GOVbin7744_45 [Prokaryotic dsDNA virus sp.]|nr:MAG: hypothetical protein GOVbin7744_45 [Prokaryotic dsDNA virus sp.]|tara:strand:+ start:28270 stop:28506 length:237 start_codon:yes stop_codon:yes gene_type:complete